MNAITGIFATSCIASCKRPGVLEVRKVEDLPEDFCDVIVTDPPYGFNTNEQIADLAELYVKMIDRMVLALRRDEGGQIVIAVPDWSHTGRQLPLFALKGLITQQILIAAKRRSKDIMGSAHVTHPHFSRPPYYWESDRALRRAILHFRIKPSSTRKE